MAGELQLAYGRTARTLYALVRNTAGQVWQTTNSTFVSYVTANLANYTVSLTEQGTASGYYAGTFPAAAAGVYAVEVRDRAGGSAAETDPVAGTGRVQWDGSAVAYLGTAPALVRTALPNVAAGASGGLPTGDGSGRVTVAAIAADAVSASALAADAASEIGVAVWAAGARTLTSNPGLSAAQVAAAVWDEAQTSHTTAGTFGQYLDAAVSSRSTLSATQVWAAGTRTLTSAANVTSDGATISQTQLARLDADVSSRSTYAGGDTAGTTTLLTRVTAAVPTAAQNADALLGRNIAGGSSAGRTVGEALAVLRNKVAISGTTMTVYSTDDTTPLWTATVTAAAGADPISAVDPG